MPRHPRHSERARTVLAGDFGRAPASDLRGLAHLHIGDSATPPGPELPLAAELNALSPWWHRYPAPAGTGKLRRALADFYTRHHGLPTAPEQILVGPGATAALNTLVHLLCDAGDEVIVPTPVWPLFPGMVRLAGARAVEVPLHEAVDTLHPGELERRLEAVLTPKSVLVYLNTPNNPAGTLMDEAQRRCVLDFAQRHDLWVVSDEAYDSMAFDGRSTPTLAALAPEDDRVFVVSTFSKIHRAAGLRLGWLRGEAGLVARAIRISTFQVYSGSALAQELVEPAVRSRDAWSGAVVAELEARRNRFIAALELEVPLPAATYFAFLDLRPWLGADIDGARAVAELLEQGVCVTAGVEFGSAYRGWIRACFASEPADRTEEAAGRIGRWIRERSSRRR